MCLCGLKHFDVKSRTLQDKDVVLSIKNTFRGRISGVMGLRYIGSDKN